MEALVSTLCDSASDYQGKLCLLGAFDTMFTRQFPLIHNSCALALRIKFSTGDEGLRKFSIRLIDADGKDVIDPFEPEIDVKLPPVEDFFVTHNLILNLQRLRIPQAGVYSFVVSVDGEILTQAPLRALEIPQQAQQGQPQANS